MQHGQHVIAPVPQQLVLCPVLFPDDLHTKLFPVICALKLSPLLECINQKGSACFREHPAAPQTIHQNVKWKHFSWITPMGVRCVSGGGFSKERTEQPGSGIAAFFCESRFSLELFGIGVSTSIRYCHPDLHQLCCSAANCITCNRDSLGKIRPATTCPKEHVAFATSSASPPSSYIHSPGMMTHKETWRKVTLLIFLCCFSLLLCVEGCNVFD